jgi:hypothetical protein
LSVWLRRSSRNANLTRAGATAQICERFSTSSSCPRFRQDRPSARARPAVEIDYAHRLLRARNPLSHSVAKASLRPGRAAIRQRLGWPRRLRLHRHTQRHKLAYQPLQHARRQRPRSSQFSEPSMVDRLRRRSCGDQLQHVGLGESSSGRSSHAVIHAGHDMHSSPGTGGKLFTAATEFLREAARIVEAQCPVARLGQLIPSRRSEQCDRSASCISPGQISTPMRPTRPRGSCGQPKQPSIVTGVMVPGHPQQQTGHISPYTLGRANLYSYNR